MVCIELDVQVLKYTRKPDGKYSGFHFAAYWPDMALSGQFASAAANVLLSCEFWVLDVRV